MDEAADRGSQAMTLRRCRWSEAKRRLLFEATRRRAAGLRALSVPNWRRLGRVPARGRQETSRAQTDPQEKELGSAV
jgi:hypothetical protein